MGACEICGAPDWADHEDPECLSDASGDADEDLQDVVEVLSMFDGPLVL
jgi:hypothetical protein